LTLVETDSTALRPPLIGALLRMPWETVRERMLAGLHERGYTDLIAAHLNVLQYPGPENLRPSDIATQTRMTKQALNYLLGQLEQLGYLTRKEDNADHRVKRVHLTPHGHAAITAIREVVIEVEIEWTETLGSRRFAQLRELLAQLSLNTSAASQDPPSGTARQPPSPPQANGGRRAPLAEIRHPRQHRPM
jgi:DNA-binding MarR family transcriptional regulator